MHLQGALVKSIELSADINARLNCNYVNSAQNQSKGKLQKQAKVQMAPVHSERPMERHVSLATSAIPQLDASRVELTGLSLIPPTVTK